MKKIYTIFLGYFGNGNIGDELILDGTLRSRKYKNPVIISSNPWLHRDKYKVRAIFKYNFLSIILILFKTKELLIPGGGIFQDISSSRSLYYYLLFIILARVFGIKIVIKNVGIGPFINFYNKILTRHILKSASFLSVRDEESLKLINLKKAVLGHDTIYEIDQYYDKGTYVKNEKINIGINLRKWQNINKVITDLGFALSEFKNRPDINFLLIPFSPADEKYLVKLYQHTGEFTFLVNTNPENIFTVINQCDICIGMRLHFTAIANFLHKNIINITYDAKCKNAVKKGNDIVFLSIKQLNKYSIIKNIRKVINKVQKI